MKRRPSNTSCDSSASALRVREVLVVDDGSIDGTPEIAAGAGASVMMSTLLGKGASMRDGLAATQGEIVLFLDGDLLEIRDDFVETLVDPILNRGRRSRQSQIHSQRGTSDCLDGPTVAECLLSRTVRSSSNRLEASSRLVARCWAESDWRMTTASTLVFSSTRP